MEGPLARPRVIRKCSYGRTVLFSKNQNTLFREVQSHGKLVRRSATSLYHTLPEAFLTPGAACWHCCEPVHDNAAVVPIPRMYDPDQRVYYVYGRTCGPACAKAYIVEHTAFDRGQHLSTLTRMMREAFDYTGAIIEAPPRSSLKRFGGVFDPSRLPKVSCRLIEPPFVSYCMVIEEQDVFTHEQCSVPTLAPMDEDTVGTEDMLGGPQQPALFDDFLAQRAPQGGGKATGKAAAPSSTTPSASGPMSKFVKK